MTPNMSPPRAGATLRRQIQVRNTLDSVPLPCDSLMAAFETPVSLLRDGATIEQDGRIVATYFAKDERGGDWRVWVYGGLA